MNKKERLQEVLRRLEKEYPVNLRGPFVNWSNPLELAIGTMLSAQCTDARVNMVTATLFEKYKTAKDYAEANPAVLEKELYTCGFYRAKTRHAIGIGTILVEKYNGAVPKDLDAIMSLPGISKKSASLIMGKAFGVNVGVPVDTHVLRVAPRLGFSNAKNAQKMSRELEALLKSEDYLRINELFIMHGRAICAPRTPKCGQCVLADICPSAQKYLAG
jgi:endonuclease-3